MRLFRSYRENFDNESPFDPNKMSPSEWTANGAKVCKDELATCEKFQETTADSFAQLIAEIKVRI